MASAAITKPTPAQMKALQHLRDGKLIIKTPVHAFLNRVSLDAPGLGYLIPEVTAKKLIAQGWVELTKFRSGEGEYKLTPEGRIETEQLCECKSKNRGGRRASSFILLSGIDPAATLTGSERATPSGGFIEWKKERLLCRRCWRLAPCEGKFFKHLHPANRYVWGVGPICQRHFDNPTRR